MTKRKSKPTAVTVTAAFWDTSGIVPLCCYQPQSSTARQAARTYSRQIVWWASSVEAVSSLQRLMRDQFLAREQYRQALHRLDYLRSRWNEIQPTDEVRHQAERLLGVHRVRAADALQLAAALVWCGNRPRGRYFIGGDNQLVDVAEIEGFSIVRLR